MNIEYLGNCRHVIPVLADWIYNEWSFLYPGKTPKYIESLLHKRVNKNRLPLTLVAFDSGEPVGTVSLKKFDMDKRRSLTPWVTSLYVPERWRRKGIGSSLMNAIEQKAAEFEFYRVYLVATTRLVPFYLKWGWTVKEKTRYRSYHVVIMKKTIG